MTSLSKIDWQAKLIEAIPLLVGVVITRRLNLHGWRAILAYIAAAGVTRQLIEILESEVNLDNLLSGLASTPADSNGHGQPSTVAAQALTLPLSEETPQIVHATPGRLRLRVPSADNPLYARHLQQQLEADQRLKSVRVNPHAASVTVKYNPKRFTETEVRVYLSELLQLALATFSEQRFSEV